MLGAFRSHLKHCFFVKILLLESTLKGVVLICSFPPSGSLKVAGRWVRPQPILHPSRARQTWLTARPRGCTALWGPSSTMPRTTRIAVRSARAWWASCWIGRTGWTGSQAMYNIRWMNWMITGQWGSYSRTSSLHDNLSKKYLLKTLNTLRLIRVGVK